MTAETHDPLDASDSAAMDRREFNKGVITSVAGFAAVSAAGILSQHLSHTEKMLTAADIQRLLDDQLEHGGIRLVTLQEAMEKENVGCGDGRRKTPVAGVFGGSTGRLIEEAAAVEELSGVLNAEETELLVEKRIHTLGGVHLHTDLHHGIAHLAQHLNTDLANAQKVLQAPGGNYDDLLHALLDPDCIACGDLRNKLTHPEAYPHLRKELVRGILEAVYKHMLRSPNDVRYEVIEEPEHGEQGILIVSGDARDADDVVPLVTPNWKGKQMFVVTDPVAQALDRSFVENVEALTGRGGINPADLMRELERQSPGFLAATAKAVTVNGRPASSLPKFIGRYDQKTGRITVAKG